MATSTEALSFSNVAASPPAFGLKGGKYAIAAVATGAGTMGLSMVGPDGATLIPVHTAFAAVTGYAVVDLPPGRYQFVLATFTAVYASICRVPS
jgi:hypothetical protein